MGQPVLFGSYELLDRIAQGGMAEVWRARSRGAAGFEKVVVLKRVLPALMAKPGFAELLIREAKIAARLSHPRIVQIFDLGEENGSYFIAMEYVHGRSLDHAMAYRGSAHAEGLSTALRVWIVAEVAGALDHAHRRKGDEGRPMQIVHRDVSPQNILLGYEGEVKVADFGIARADEQGLGRGEDPKILRGKYAYMSPEQARGEPLDRRSDIFSLGIVLYELLTGNRMFRGKSSQDTLAMVRDAELPPLDAVSLDIDPQLAAVLARCLSPSREERYGWGSEIYNDLTQWLFRRGEAVGQPFLAEAMSRMFPPEDSIAPNKLRVDLLMRAYQDATSISAAGAILPRAVAEDSTDAAGTKTAAMPTSRRMKVELRRLALLVAENRAGEDEAFALACDAASGVVFPAQPDAPLRVAAFGHVAGVERGVAHAARAALELRRQLRVEGPARLEQVPPMAVLDGEGRIVEGIATEPEPELMERARALLDGAAPGEIRVSRELVPELAHAFRIDEGTGRAPVIEGFRARAERDAIALRRRAPLAGRRDELRRLSEAVIGVIEGGQRMIQIVGEPGAGKSRLVAELRAIVASRDVHVVTGRADEADTERPLAALADLVRDLCGVEAEDTPSERFAKVERLRVLNLGAREVRVCGELLGLAYPVASVERAGRPRGIEIVVAIRKAISQLAQDRAVILVLEDLQWLDDSTRQLVSLFLKGLARPRVMVVMTRRPGALVPHLPGETLRLAPLAPDAAGRLFAASLGARAVEPELAATVQHETGGIPAWIEMLAGEARGAGSVTVEDGVARGIAPMPDAVPIAARNWVAARVAQLRPLERAILTVAACFEGPVSTDAILAIEGLVGTVASVPLRRLLARRLLISSGATPFDDAASEAVGRWGGDDAASDRPERVALPGRMLQRAVLETVEPAELRRLHGRIVAMMERTGTDKTAEGMRRLAYHASRSIDRRRAPEYLVRSAELARAAGEVRLAAKDLALASRIVREEGEDPGGDKSVELGLRAVQLALEAGAVDDALSVLDALAEVHGDRGRAGTRLAIATARAEAALLAERAEDAVAALERVDDVVRSAAPSARGAARLVLGRALLEACRVEDALVALSEAVAAFRESGEVAGRGRALAVLALAQAHAGRAGEADDTAEEALAVAARLGHGELRYAALAAMGAAQEAAGDRVGAAARLREAAEVASHVGLDAEIAVAALRAAVACFRAGESVEAAQRVEQAIRLGRRRKIERISVLGTALQAALAIQSDPDPSWVPAIVRAIERLEGIERFGDAAIAVELLATAQRALGDEPAARRALARGVELARRAGWIALARALEDEITPNGV